MSKSNTQSPFFVVPNLLHATDLVEIMQSSHVNEDGLY